MSIVQEYLKEKRAEKEQIKKEKKEQVLINAGLYEKVYRKEDENESGFSFYDYDKEEYYNEVAPNVTDEEYEEILKYSEVEFDEGKKNKIASAIKGIGILTIFVGIIVGIIVGCIEYEISEESSAFFITAISYWAGSIISGIMFLGFGEIIKLLQDIKNNQDEGKRKL